MDASLRVKFWGTRGHISSPRRDTAIYGGNTTCMQILYKDHLIIVDTGFGVSNLGEELMDRIIKNGEKLTIHIFFTHFHWDHIQGLPFFHPIYFPSSVLRLYSPYPEAQARENLDLLFDGSYSPFEGMGSMPSSIEFVALEDKGTKIDGLTFTHIELDHGTSSKDNTDDMSTPLTHGAHAYKIATDDGETLVIATDHEARDSQINRGLIEFARGCDLLIHDGHYLGEEYRTRVGWGHSTMTQAIENALRCGCKRLLLTHHDPARNDDAINEAARQFLMEERYRELEFEFAREAVEYGVTAPPSGHKKDSR